MILIDLELTISYLIKYGSSDMLIFKIWNRMRSLENSLDDFGGEICKGHSKFPKKTCHGEVPSKFRKFVRIRRENP